MPRTRRRQARYDARSSFFKASGHGHRRFRTVVGRETSHTRESARRLSGPAPAEEIVPLLLAGEEESPPLADEEDLTRRAGALEIAVCEPVLAGLRDLQPREEVDEPALVPSVRRR